ncbi:MAG TPA: tetratricopeptide repeat protein, partial [Nannocystaceae bacterium]|nr:tetratricopeptide repeat protein [Nannocystaceae bacterium]
APIPPPPDPTSATDPSASAAASPTSIRDGADGSANEWVARGKALLAAGDAKGAERAFHRALEIDRRHVGALTALAQLHFDRGEHSEVLKYAARGVAAAPKNAKLRILLGDAHLKVLAYDEARVQYEKAAALGHSAAKGRLELLRDKLGH